MTMKTQGVCSYTLIVLLTLFYIVATETFQSNLRYGKKDKFYDAGGRYGKRDSENGQFYMDDHIARRSNRLWAGKGSGDVQQVSPRAERFFMGSRYGKRTGTEEANGAENEPDEQMSCQFTGMANLYLCFNSRERSQESDSTVQEASNN